MLYPIHVLEDAEARVAGRERARALLALRPERVTFRYGGAALARVVWSLPVVDAIAAQFPRAAVRVWARPVAARLVGAHVANRARVGDARAPTFELVVDMTGRAKAARFEREGRVHHLTVPRAPYPERAQHASAHWIDAAHVAGLAARVTAPRLRIPSAAAREARAMCRWMTRTRGGPVVAIVGRRGGWGDAPFRALIDRLHSKIGANAIVMGPIDAPGAVRVPEADPAVIAALFALCAVCVADEGGWAHVAAAAGAPVVTIHRGSSPLRTGPASRLGAALFSRRDIDPARAADVAEKLAARRWPWDRLLRAIP